MFLVFLIPAALLLLRQRLFRSDPSPVGDVDYMQYQLNVIASVKSAKHRDEIKRVVAIIKVKLPYFFHYDRRIDGSYCINGPPECEYRDGIWARSFGYDLYMGGIFHGCNPADPIYALIRTDNCPIHARRIIEEALHEIVPGAEVKLVNNDGFTI